MRVTTDLWAAALIRRVFSDGGYAAIAAKGATEAGAAFIVARSRDGNFTLYGPASQSDYEGRPDDRRFRLIATSDDEQELAGRIERERRFDPDLWIIDLEVEDDKLRDYLDIVGA